MICSLRRARGRARVRARKNELAENAFSNTLTALDGDSLFYILYSTEHRTT
jgi:hypothetical protein